MDNMFKTSKKGKITEHINKLDDDTGVNSISTTVKLSSGKKFTIVNYKPKGYNDDDYYKNTKSENSVYMRRGLACVYDNDVILAIITGSTKFGNKGHIFTESKISKTKCVKKIYTVKENGEAGRLTFFCYDKKWYAIVGSKNVDCVFCVDSKKEALEDLAIETYKVKRFSCAIANAKLLLECHSDIMFNNTEMKNTLYDNNMTIIFEAIFNNHLVDYDSNCIKPFALTIPQYASIEEQELCFYTENAFHLLSEWGFRVPNHDIATSEDDYAFFDSKYRTMPNSEGAVVYEVFQNEDGELKIHNIYKHKNDMYIIHRAARELIKKLADYSAWIKRFSDFHFNTDHLANEIKNLLAFYVWLIKKNTNKGEYMTWSEMIQKKFKDLLHEFNKELAGQTLQDLVNDAPRCLDFYASRRNNEDSVIMLVGIPGSGKTTLRIALFSMLGANKCDYINQDELNGNKKAFDSMLNNQSKNKGKKKVVIVDKCNNRFDNRNKVYELFKNVTIIEFVHPEGCKKMKELCYKRIEGRRIAHESLSVFHTTDVNKILSNMTDDFEHLTDFEKENNKYIKLNPLDNIDKNLCTVIEFLSSSGILMEYSKDKVISSLEQDKINKETKFLKKVIYLRASADVSAIKSLINDKYIQLIMNGFPKKEEYHVTLWFNKDKSISKNEFEAYMNETNIRVEVVAIAYNKKCVALKIKGLSVPCDNKIPHITLGVVDGITPVYANEMLQLGDYEEVVINNIYLDLKINPVIKKY
jgi:hypothetical protein